MQQVLYHATLNPNGQGSKLSGNINFIPYLTSPYISTTTVQVFGTLIGSFNGVAAYSNGRVDSVSNVYNSATGINTGMEWQCVEYVNRYYYIIYGLDIRIVGQNANQYYDNASSRKLVSYVNAGKTTPQVGDILCFSGGSAGHVAIIRNVGTTTVTVIQQNVRENSDDTNYTYPLSISSGTFTIDGSRLGTGYACQGWLRTPGASIVRDNSGSLPHTYSLFQNYPNPFNPTTTISFSLAQQSFVSLKVFDVTGREVSTIVSKQLQEGSYTQQWNAANMSSGVYFYRLQAGLFTEMKKLLLLK